MAVTDPPRAARSWERRAEGSAEHSSKGWMALDCSAGKTGCDTGNTWSTERKSNGFGKNGSSIGPNFGVPSRTPDLIRQPWVKLSEESGILLLSSKIKPGPKEELSLHSSVFKAQDPKM